MPNLFEKFTIQFLKKHKKDFQSFKTINVKPAIFWCFQRVEKWNLMKNYFLIISTSIKIEDSIKMSWNIITLHNNQKETFTENMHWQNVDPCDISVTGISGLWTWETILTRSPYKSHFFSFLSWHKLIPNRSFTCDRYILSLFPQPFLNL